MGVEPCLHVYVVEWVTMLIRSLFKLKKRQFRDEMQKQGAKWQVWRERLLMGSGLAEHSIWAHNLLKYIDR